MNNTRYTFGTNETAASRLETLAGIFNTYSSEFIRKQVKAPVASAIDLGCGPGFTTHMLSMAVDSKEIYGMDNSEDFLIKAMDRFGDCIFIRHDVNNTPFPIRSDMIYMRFVLSHMPNPVRLINKWINELNDGGMVLIEEMENIDTDVNVFKEYLAVNKGLVASSGADLFVGRNLSKGMYDADVVLNECIELPVKNSDAARMFYPNTISIWENEKFVLENYSFNRRKEISHEIKDIMDSKDKRIGITWKMRRIVLRKNEYDEYSELFI
jgi:ubiquinone/menaquinone biosynthesis C-methylase UbiE